MTMHLISVVPAAPGWVMTSTAFDNEMVFGSGAKAEAAARHLGEKIARHGQQAEIEIHLRDGSLAARFVFAPNRNAVEPPAPHWERPHSSAA
jgi:hypothetical protein